MTVFNPRQKAAERHASHRTRPIPALIPALLFAWIGGVSGGVPAALANPSDATQTCDRVARLAAAESGIPAEVMLAITRTETGRRRAGQLAPWPWTVNMEGQGKWFETRAAALDYAVTHHAGGARSFDVGCFQLNYRWHGQHFDGISQMFEPMENARYAAQFLSGLYAETGSWEEAAAAYHSRTPKYADKYKARFKRILASLPAGPEAAPEPAVAARENRFPLLQSGQQTAALGSLVPLGGTGSQPLFGSGG